VRLRLGVLVVLLVLIVGSLATVGGLALSRHANPFSGVDKTQTTRDEVMAQTRQFMLRVNTYGPSMLQGTTMPSYRKQVEAVMTAKFKTDFEQNVPYAEATVAQAGVQRTTTVYAVGVSDIEDTRATALVAGEFTNSFPDKKDPSKRVPTDPQPYRVEVTLDRVGGTWLIDGFQPVQSPQSQGSGTAGSSGSSPSPSTTAPASPSASGSAQ
jgi:hypothetical protein